MDILVRDVQKMERRSRLQYNFVLDPARADRTFLSVCRIDKNCLAILRPYSTLHQISPIALPLKAFN